MLPRNIPGHNLWIPSPLLGIPSTWCIVGPSFNFLTLFKVPAKIDHDQSEVTVIVPAPLASIWLSCLSYPDPAYHCSTRPCGHGSCDVAKCPIVAECHLVQSVRKTRFFPLQNTRVAKWSIFMKFSRMLQSVRKTRVFPLQNVCVAKWSLQNGP